MLLSWIVGWIFAAESSECQQTVECTEHNRLKRRLEWIDMHSRCMKAATREPLHNKRHGWCTWLSHHEEMSSCPETLIYWARTCSRWHQWALITWNDSLSSLLLSLSCQSDTQKCDSTRGQDSSPGKWRGHRWYHLKYAQQVDWAVVDLSLVTRSGGSRRWVKEKVSMHGQDLLVTANKNGQHASEKERAKERSNLLGSLSLAAK